MPKRLQVSRLILGSVLCAIPSALFAQTNIGCVSATDPHAHVYRDGYGSMVSRTDPGSVAQRTNLGLPNIPDAQVTIVSDTTKCRIASTAYDAALSASAASEPPLVLQLGTQYVVVKRLKFPRGRVNVLFNQDFSIPQKTIWY
jgi:hypothetical protein